MTPARSTTVSRVIAAPRERIYCAFLKAEAVATGLPPDTRKGSGHDVEGRE
ncbi:ATPase, partial [Rhizobium ruizarguesonis]